MPNIINIKNGCLINSGNTGFGSCVNELGIPRGFIVGEVGVPIAASTLAVFLSAMQSLTLEDKPYNRAFPVHNIMQVDPTGGDAVKFTETATGRSVTTGVNDVTISFRWRVGGMCLLVSLLTESGAGKDVGLMIYDNLGQIWATKSQTADSVEFWPANQFTPPVGIATAPGEPAKYMTEFSFDPFWMNKNLALIDCNPQGGLRAIKTLEGLQDVTLYPAAVRALGVFTIGAKTNCGTVDLHDDFATALSSTSAWRAYNTNTGKVIPITSVADDPVNGGWTITLPTGNANYSATTGGVQIQLGTPLTIFGLTQMNFESNKLAQ